MIPGFIICASLVDIPCLHCCCYANAVYRKYVCATMPLPSPYSPCTIWYYRQSWYRYTLSAHTYIEYHKWWYHLFINLRYTNHLQNMYLVVQIVNIIFICIQYYDAYYRCQLLILNIILNNKL